MISDDEPSVVGELASDLPRDLHPVLDPFERACEAHAHARERPSRGASRSRGLRHGEERGQDGAIDRQKSRDGLEVPTLQIAHDTVGERRLHQGGEVGVMCAEDLLTFEPHSCAVACRASPSASLTIRSSSARSSRSR